MVILIIWAPILWGLGAAVVSGMSVLCWGAMGEKESIPPVNGKKLAILGMDQSGKTHYFHFLQGKEYLNAQQTERDEIESFTYTKSDGTTIKIKKGIDIGGSQRFTYLYEELMNNSDCVIFMFDISKYFKDDEYRKDVHSRLEFINRKKISKGIADCNFKIFATHADLLDCNELNEAKTMFVNNIKNKDYKDILKCDIFIINLQEKDKVKEITDKIL